MILASIVASAAAFAPVQEGRTSSAIAANPLADELGAMAPVSFLSAEIVEADVGTGSILEYNNNYTDNIFFSIQTTITAWILRSSWTL